MQKFIGTSRTVYVIPELGIAIKVANVHFRKVYFSLKSCLRRRDKKVWGFFLEPNIQKPVTLWNMLFCGIWSNLREWHYTIEFGTKFITPTYFSIGLCSIVHCVTPIANLSTEESEANDLVFGIDGALWRCFRRVVSDKELRSDGHHWLNHKNFGFLHDHVVLCDYGSPITQSILHKHAIQLAELDYGSLVRPQSDHSR